jgi:hypothetical protein
VRKKGKRPVGAVKKQTRKAGKRKDFMAMKQITEKTVTRSVFNIEGSGGSVKFYTKNGNEFKNQTKGLSFGTYFETGKDGYVYLVGENIPQSTIAHMLSFIKGHKYIYIKVGPNSRVESNEIKWPDPTTITLVKGTWEEDKDAKELAVFDDLMGFLSCAESQKIVNQVAKWKGNRTKDQLVDYIIAQKSVKSGFIGGIAGIGGALAIPNQFLAVLTNWCVQSEMAYAISCVYQEKPLSSDEFKKDLYWLLPDIDFNDIEFNDAALKAAIPKLSGEITKEMVKKVAIDVMVKLLEAISKQQTRKLAAKAATVTLKAIPVVSSVVDASANFAEAKKLGNRAKKYYSAVSASVPAPVIGSFKVSPDISAPDQEVTLSWSGVSGANKSLSIDQGIGTVSGASGTKKTKAPSALAKTWTLKAVGNGGETSKSVTVKVPSLVTASTFSNPTLKPTPTPSKPTPTPSKPTPAPSTTRPSLSQGSSKKEDVKYLQQRLNALMNAGLKVEGNFGPATKAAVIAFQKKKGLKADGVVGTNTWAALK